MRPITPSSLLDSICWSVSEPTSTASIYTDSLGSDDGRLPVFFDAKADGKESEASFTNLTRPLTERLVLEDTFRLLRSVHCLMNLHKMNWALCSENSELVFKEHFLTILFPVDRFSEMGPSTRTFFSQKGFTCLKVLDHIYEFYQVRSRFLPTESGVYLLSLFILQH